MKIRIDELEEIKYQIEKLIEGMEEKNIEELHLKPNTYGLYGKFISIPSKGYLEIEDIYNLLAKEQEEEF